MDNDRLNQLLEDAANRRFWLKPIGLGDRPIVMNGSVKENFGEAEVEILFTRKADEIRVGDVLIVYRVGVAAVMYVAERLPRSEWTTDQIEYPAGVRDRYPESFKARNLTPTFGEHWQQFIIKPFTLANRITPQPGMEPVKLGTLNWSNDRARIPQWFAELLIRRIQAASLRPETATTPDSELVAAEAGPSLQGQHEVLPGS